MRALSGVKRGFLRVMCDTHSPACPTTRSSHARLTRAGVATPATSPMTRTSSASGASVPPSR